MARAKAKAAKNEETVEVLPPAVPDNTINEAVQEINLLSRDALVDLMIEVGRIVVEKCYGGDLTAWRERGESDSSFRKLAAHPDLQMKASGLSRAVGIFDLEQRLGVSARKQLTATHLRAVLGLPEKTQKRLLENAETKNWNTRQLEDEATKARKKAGEKRGRPPLPRFVKTVNRFAKILEAPDEHFGDLSAVDNLKADDAQKLYQAVSGMKLQCEILEEKLKERVTGA